MNAARVPVEDKDDKKRRAEKRQAIGKHLKTAYEDVVNEPLPDAFEDLLRQLDDQTSNKTDKDEA